MNQQISVVTTLYKSESHLLDFYRRMREQLHGHAYQMIFVNDGSPDNSLALALNLARSDENVEVINLARNFGHHKAMLQGLTYAHGDLVFVIDSDLEEPPEVFGEFFERHQKEAVDLVYGVRSSRSGSFVSRVGGKLFYAAFNLLANPPIAENVVMARLMSRRYCDALLQHREREVFLAGLCELTGFSQRALTIDKSSNSPSTYSLSARIDLAVTAITSFSEKPLRLMFYVGMLTWLGSLFFVAYVLIQKLCFDAQVGWASVIASIWFFSGCIILHLGVLGIYVAKLFLEVKARPRAIVAEHYKFKHSTSEDDRE